MLNTVADLAGERFVVAATPTTTDAPSRRLPPSSAPGVRSPRHLHGCGETVQSCDSDIRVFCTEAILRTGAWGVGSSSNDRAMLASALCSFRSLGRGSSSSPCVTVNSQPEPPEVGLRMARLYDAILASAARHGAPISSQLISYILQER